MKEITTERPNIFEPNVYISFYLTLAQIVETEALIKAIQTAYESNETTLSNISLRNGIAGYEAMPKSGCTIHVTQKSWKTIVKENEKIPFQVQQGELIRSFIVESQEKTSLLIMAHHLAGDGKSIIYFIQDIMNALAGRKLKKKPLSLLTRNEINQTGHLPFWVTCYTAFCNRIWRAMGRPEFTWEDYNNIHKKYWESNASRIEYQTFSVAKTKQIIENAKKMGITVNSYIIATFLKEIDKRSVIGIPVSIRDKDNTSMGNFTSGISICQKYNKKKPFSMNAKLTHKKVRNILEKKSWFVLQFLQELSPTLIDAVLLNTHGCMKNSLAEHLGKNMGYKGKKVRDLGVTNLMQLNIPVEYGEYRLEDILFVPPAVSYSHNVMGILTYDGKMTIAYHGMEKLTSSNT